MLCTDIKFCYEIMIKAFSCLWPQISLIFKDAFSLHDATSVKVERCSVCIYNFTGVAETSTAGLENNFSAFFLMDYLAHDLSVFWYCEIKIGFLFS